MNISNSGSIVVTGQSIGSTNQYTTVKYNTLKRSNEVVYVEGTPHHKANELIVKFVPKHVNTKFVDNRQKRYGKAYEVLSGQAVQKISTYVDLEGSFFAKVFPRLSTGHKRSITRLGDTIAMPKFWTTFVILFEEEQNLEELIEVFESMPEFVAYAHLNHVYQPETLPNDQFFQDDQQASLFPSPDFSDAHINVEPAWDLETGQNYTKVGVFDTPIFWAHEDFGDGTLEGSQVEGGWDFVNNVHITGVENPYSHGTSTGGIIGALRDNNIGIAGIAGGGLDAQGNNNEGVQLFSLGVAVGYEIIPVDVVAPAIVEGAMYDETQDPPGYGLHIQNHSWTGDNDPLLSSTVNFCFRNQCVLVASRGNQGTDILRYPACYNDDWVLSVGASGTDGQYYDGSNGDDSFNWASNFGGGVDFIAPGVTDLTMTPINPDNPSYTFTNAPPTMGDNQDYQSFNGTSAAAPHVAGVAALMHSLHHLNKGQSNNLAPEDIEFLLQRYATDIFGGIEGYPIGYDKNNGWGRINAFETLQRLQAPHWRVFHSGEPDEGGTEMNEIVSNTTFIVNGGVVPGLIQDNYHGDIIEIIHTYSNEFSPTTQIQGEWERTSSTNGTHLGGVASSSPWADYAFNIEDNEATVKITTYAWHITSNELGIPFDIWHPAPPEDIRTAYSLHLFDPIATGGVGNNIENDLGFVALYPNPTDNNVRLHYYLQNAIPHTVKVLDIMGKVFLEQDLSTEKAGELSLDCSSLEDGIYICQFLTDKGSIIKKIIKQ